MEISSIPGLHVKPYREENGSRSMSRPTNITSWCIWGVVDCQKQLSTDMETRVRIQVMSNKQASSAH